MELKYYTLKSAAEKTGYSEEDLIYLAATDQLSLYFRKGSSLCEYEYQEFAVNEFGEEQDEIYHDCFLLNETFARTKAPKMVK